MKSFKEDYLAQVMLITIYTPLLLIGKLKGALAIFFG